MCIGHTSCSLYFVPVLHLFQIKCLHVRFRQSNGAVNLHFFHLKSDIDSNFSDPSTIKKTKNWNSTQSRYGKCHLYLLVVYCVNLEAKWANSRLFRYHPGFFPLDPDFCFVFIQISSFLGLRLLLFLSRFHVEGSWRVYCSSPRSSWLSAKENAFQYFWWIPEYWQKHVVKNSRPKIPIDFLRDPTKAVRWNGSGGRAVG